MLGSEDAARRPTGLKALVLADARAAMPLRIAAADQLRRVLPPDVLATTLRHELYGTLDDPAYGQAGYDPYSGNRSRIAASSCRIRSPSGTA